MVDGSWVVALQVQQNTRLVLYHTKVHYFTLVQIYVVVVAITLDVKSVCAKIVKLILTDIFLTNKLRKFA